MNKPLLKCDLHDYIEIVCLYRIEVEITLQNNVCLTGIPLTTGVNKKVGEYLVFRSNNKADTRSIPLLSLQSMQAVSANIHFNKINFF